MNKDVKLYSSTNFREETPGDMRNALRLIAKEIQSFRLDYELGKQKIHDNNAEAEDSYSMKFYKKNKHLKVLKKNLQTICNVAKIILSAKNREREFLISHLNEMRNESLDIRKINAQNVSLIHKLRIGNNNINNDLLLLSNFIHLAYEKLQNMRNETPKYVPCIEELKAIILACGQYHADFCNAHDRCAQLERKNRFLKNKLNIVENNLAATTEELRNLRNQNMKLRIKCELNHKTRGARTENMTDPNVSEKFNKLLHDGIRRRGNAAIINTAQYKDAQDIISKRGISSHLETVRNLILDQDNMLKELKGLYLEVLTPDPSFQI